jgi:hypothetical protein
LRAENRLEGIDALATNEPGHVLDWVMQPISYARHRFPPDIIRHAVWLYLRFTLSYRDVEDLLAERGLMVSNEPIRRWVLKFGPIIAKNLRAIRPKPHSRWHIDEMMVSIAGRQMYMWRAVAEALDAVCAAAPAHQISRGRARREPGRSRTLSRLAKFDGQDRVARDRVARIVSIDRAPQCRA